MFALDQTLPSSYHTAELRAEARRDALARQVSRHRVRALVRRLAR